MVVVYRVFIQGAYKGYEGLYGPGYKGWWMALTGRSMGALVARADAVGTMASHYPPLKNKCPLNKIVFSYQGCKAGVFVPPFKFSCTRVIDQHEGEFQPKV